jgi:hypothetical protein
MHRTKNEQERGLGTVLMSRDPLELPEGPSAQ